MKIIAAIALFAALISADAAEAKGRKPCCATKEPSVDCGAGCGACYKNYIQKMDFYHTKPVLSGAGKNWMYFFESEDPALSANDGVFTADCHGGVVNSQVYTHYYNDTSQPVLDNAKYVIYASAPAPIPNNGDLVVEWEGSVETFNTDQNPYPTQITQLNDVRLASGLYFAFDFDTYYALAWLLTNDRVYAVYIRYNFGWVIDDPASQYASFTFLIPVKMRKPCDWHNMKVVAHGASKQVSWRLDGREVFRVTKLGYLIDRQYMLVDYGGQEGPAFPTQLYYGFGTVTMVNAYPACKRSDTCCDCMFPSVREALANPTNYTIGFPQYNPLLGPPNPAIFWADFGSTVEADFIWGQGTVLSIRKLVVYQDLCSGRKC